MVPSDLRRRAFRAYEEGRFLRAVRVGVLALPMAALSGGCCGNSVYSIVCGVLLCALSTALLWRGGAAGRAVVPGLVAGFVPLLAPLSAERAFLLLDVPFTVRACVTVCTLAGCASGGIVALFASRVDKERGLFVVVAGLVAAMGGSMGCVLIGAGGIAAMTAGLALVSVPAVLRPARVG